MDWPWIPRLPPSQKTLPGQAGAPRAPLGWRDSDTRQEKGGKSHLASRNFLSRLGRSWLRRRRNQRSTWRTVQPLFLESISTSAWGGTPGQPLLCHRALPLPPSAPQAPLGTPHLLGVFAGGGVKLLQHRIGGGF